MPKFLKNKKVLICIASVLILSILIVGGIFLFKGNNKEDAKDNKQETTNNYVAYVKINPLIKLEFSQTCRNTNKNDNINRDCSDPVITKYELVNDDAKRIYKDVNLIDITDMWFMLDLIYTTAREQNIKVDTVDIYSDWTKLEQYMEDKMDTTYNWKYNINIKPKEELKDIVNTLENENKSYNVTFDTDGGSKIDKQVIKKGEKVKEPSSPTKKGYTFVEWQLEGKKFNFDTSIIKDIELKAIWKKEATSNSNHQTNNSTNNTQNNSNNKPSSNSNTPPKEEIVYFNIPWDIINNGTYQQFAKEHGITINLVASMEYQCNSHFSPPADPRGYKKGDVVIAYGYYGDGDTCLEETYQCYDGTNSFNCYGPECENNSSCHNTYSCHKYNQVFKFGACGM